MGPVEEEGQEQTEGGQRVSRLDGLRLSDEGLPGRSVTGLKMPRSFLRTVYRV